MVFIELKLRQGDVFQVSRLRLLFLLETSAQQKGEAKAPGMCCIMLYQKHVFVAGIQERDGEFSTTKLVQIYALLVLFLVQMESGIDANQ